MARASARVPIRPRAMAWSRTLPAAVASTGPAWTGIPQASAVNWQSRAFRAAAADHVDRPDRRAEDRFDPADRPAVLQGQALQGAADEGPFVGRDGLAGPAWRRRPGGRACRRGRGTSGRRARPAWRTAGRPWPWRSARHTSTRGRACAQVRRHSWTSQRPMMFFRSRVVPATPPSLVKLPRERRLVDHRPGDLDAQERPRPRADVAPVGRVGAGPSGRHGGHGAGGVVGAGDEHGQRGRRSPARRRPTCGAAPARCPGRSGRGGSTGAGPAPGKARRTRCRRRGRGAGWSRRRSARRPVGRSGASRRGRGSSAGSRPRRAAASSAVFSARS